MAQMKDAQGQYFEIVYFKDKNTGRLWKCCPCLKASLEQLDVHLRHFKLLKVGVDIFQTIGFAQASANYHAFGGNVDLAQIATEILRIMRNMGFAAFPRDGRAGEGMSVHDHAVCVNCDHMGSGPQSQVRSLNNNRNGLVSNRADRGPRSGVKWPLRTWKEGIVWSKAQIAADSPKPPTEVPVTNLDKMDPKSYYVGVKGDHVKWLADRLVLHGFSSFYANGTDTSFTSGEDKAAVAAFQRSLGWTGADADGLPGQVTLARLALDPKPAGEVQAVVHYEASLNVSDKLGNTRARAKQIVDSVYAGAQVPDVLNIQEGGGRRGTNVRSAWMELLLDEFDKRGNWWASCPTTDFNENYTLYNMDHVKNPKIHADFIIRVAGAGGRHVTKTSYEHKDQDGWRVLVGNTHLDDKANDAAVGRQAVAAVKELKADVGTVLDGVLIKDTIIAGDWNIETFPAVLKGLNFNSVGNRALRFVNWAMTTFGGASYRWAKGRHIDYIGVHDSETVTFTEVVRMKGADHHMVLSGVIFR